MKFHSSPRTESLPNVLQCISAAQVLFYLTSLQQQQNNNCLKSFIHHHLGETVPERRWQEQATSAAMQSCRQSPGESLSSSKLGPETMPRSSQQWLESCQIFALFKVSEKSTLTTQLDVNSLGSPMILPPSSPPLLRWIPFLSQ